MKHISKPIVETLINTAAIAFTAYGVTQVTTGNPWGYVPVLFGVGLELIKYWGRNKSFW